MRGCIVLERNWELGTNSGERVPQGCSRSRDPQDGGFEERLFPWECTGVI